MRVLLLAGLVALTLRAQPRAQTFVLPNGLRVVHLEDHERPLVRAWLQIELAPADTPAGLQGLPFLAMRMLAQSDAGDLKAEDFDRRVEGSGIQFTQASTSGQLAWQLVARSRDQDRALGLLADRLLRAVFDPATLEFQRLACWRDQERLDGSSRDRLRRALDLEPGTQPTLAGLGVITLDDLLAFKARVFRPGRAVLVLHGDLGLEQAKRLVFLNLGSWTDSALPPAATQARVPAPPQPEPPVRIPAPGTGLRLQAVAAPPGEFSPEAAALLGLLLPDDPALAPVQIAVADSGLVATLDQADAPMGAWPLFHGRLEALRQRGFTQLDLDRARTAWQAGRSLDTLHSEALMANALAAARGRGVSQARMEALTLATLNAELHRWLDPARLRIGAAGDPEALKTLPTP
jgi:predicted Zn-dependent peptidase